MVGQRNVAVVGAGKDVNRLFDSSCFYNKRTFPAKIYSGGGERARVFWGLVGRSYISSPFSPPSSDLVKPE